MKPITPICSSLGILIVACLALMAPAAKADYTNGLLARWSFYTGGLTDSVNGFVLKTNGTGTGQTMVFNTNNGSVVLGPGMELIATNINSTTYPTLKNGATVWVYMEVTNTPDNLSYLLGLVNANNATAASGDMTIGLMENVIVTTGYWGVSFKNTIVGSQSGTSLHPLNQFAAVAIVFTNATTQTATNYLNGTAVGSATYPGNTFPLQDFKGFALGRLLNSFGNSGGNTIFQEARVYNAALTPAQVASIVPVTNNVSPATNIIANPDFATTPWNASVTVNPLVNDYEPNGLPLTVVSVHPTNGTANIVNGTNVMITPTLGTNGTVTVGYTITNGNAGSASSLITVTVTNPLTPATNVIAYPDAASTPWNASVTVSPAANDSEPDGLTLTVVSVSPTNATAGIVNGTNVLITPTLGTTGTAYVGYTVTNGNGKSARSLITVTLTAPATPGSVAPADQFVDSIGVNVHLWFPGMPYVTSYSAVKTKMVASKLRHIRDMMAIDRGPVPAWKELATNGIKTGYVFTPEWAPSMSAYTNYIITNNLLGTVDYFEGPNEYDANAYSNPNWVSVLTNFQASLYATMKGSPQTAVFPVLAASFLINHAADRTAVGNLGAWCDYGNCHPYPGGHLPSADQTTNEIAACSINTGSMPIYITETGYHNATNGPYDGNNPASEAATAIYLPRLYFDSFARGIVRTYWYEFIESQTDSGALNNAEAHFGLIRYDLSEKPAYTALTNLITIMQDSGPGFATGNLNYSLSGAAVKSVLFQKRDGSFYLALWQEVSVWDVTTRTNIILASTNVTVGLPWSGFNVQSYSPTISAAVQQTWTGVSNVTVSLQGEVKILKISGGVQPPVANPDTISTAWNVPVTMAPLSNDSDPNGFALALLAVSPTNATASIIGGTNVLVTPVAGAAGTVLVGYTITNGNGGAASSLITVTVTSPPTPVITATLKSATNLLFYGSNGAANGVYRVLFTTNLTLPVTQWTPVWTNTFNANGSFQVTNTMNPGKPAGFYQIKQ